MKTDKTNQNKVTKFNIFSAWTWSNMAATDNTSFFWCCKKNNSHLNLSRRRKNGGVIKVITFCLVSTDQAQSKQWSLNNDKRDLKKKELLINGQVTVGDDSHMKSSALIEGQLSPSCPWDTLALSSRWGSWHHHVTACSGRPRRTIIFQPCSASLGEDTAN